MVASDRPARLEVLLLGTGTSSQVPSIACLTDPNQMGCKCCTSKDKKNHRRNTSAVIRIHHDPRPLLESTQFHGQLALDRRAPPFQVVGDDEYSSSDTTSHDFNHHYHYHNVDHHRQRPNGITQYHPDHQMSFTTTSSYSSDDDRTTPEHTFDRSTPKTSHILIDVGKSFCEAARDHFPKNRIRKIDAVLLTHPHADAINGLDDLRAWTLGGAIQESVSIYCDQYTYLEISKMYPYLTNSSAKTGGGDVPEFTWNIIEHGKSFQICDVEITPLVVYHGIFFNSSDSSSADPVKKPFECLSFLINRSIYYVSDVSEIPPSTLDVLRIKLESSNTPRNRHHKSLSVHGNQAVAPANLPPHLQFSNLASRLQVLIVDTLRLYPHTSHFGIAQAVNTIRMLNPVRSYLIGFTHGVSHACWVHCCEAISEGKQSIDYAHKTPLSPISMRHHHPHHPMQEPEQAERAIEREKLLQKGIIEDFDWFTYRSLRLIEAESPPEPTSPPMMMITTTTTTSIKSKHLSFDPSRDPSLKLLRPPSSSRLWVRPGFDGLLIRTDELTSSVWDGFYDLE